MALRSKQRKLPPPAIPKGDFLAMLLLLYGSVLPLFQELPWRITLFVTALHALAGAAEYFPRLRPNRWFLLPLTLAGVALVFKQFHTLFGYQAGIALFALMLALKIVESRSLRDFYILYILGLFMMVAQFLLHQGMMLAAWFLVLFIVSNAVLVHLNRGSSSDPLLSLRQSGVIVIQALPLAAVLFLLFPRLSSPLWSIDVGVRVGVTGLSDHMEPGSVNRLILSEEPVFRAEFDGERPEQKLLYWRGPVFWHSDGRRWSGDGPWSPPREPEFLEQRVDYRLILEATGKPWIPALDIPDSAPDGALLTADRQLLAKRPSEDRQQYRLRSYTRYHTGALSRSAREAALQLPDAMDSRVGSLVRQWTENAENDLQVVNRALSHFHEQPFVYTLSPPDTGNDPLAGFLFDTQAGFCEHYASSFTLLMRIAGVPARVVTGYLGGEHNELGGYTIVRQSDAHAWSEVWLEQSGWTRVDPTAAVAPERVLHSILNEPTEPGAPASFALGGDTWNKIGRSLVFALDTLNTNWHLWILDYNQGKRGRVLSLFGLELLGEQTIGFLMVGLILTIVLVLWWYLSRKDFIYQDPVILAYNRFCRRLAASGITRMQEEGPEDFARRAKTLRPDLAAQIGRINDLYVRIRYRGGRTTALVNRYRLEVRRFKPGRRVSNKKTPVKNPLSRET